MRIRPSMMKWSAHAHLALRVRKLRKPSENSATNAWNVNFNNGNLNNNNKTNENRVRPVSAYHREDRHYEMSGVHSVMYN